MIMETLYFTFQKLCVLTGYPSFDAHRNHARADHVNGAGRGMREIDDAPIDERASVRNTNIHRLGVREIRHVDPGLEGQGPVGGRELLHIVNLAIRGRPAMIGMAVPARQAVFRVPDSGGDGARRSRQSRVLLMGAAA